MPLLSCICALNFQIGDTAEARVVQRDHFTLAEKTSSLRRSYSKEGPGSGPHEDRSCAVGTKSGLISKNCISCKTGRQPAHSVSFRVYGKAGSWFGR
jgi:hypothetical protein